MKKTYILIVTAALILTSGILLAFNSKNSNSSDCNTESGEKCCEKKEKNTPGGMLWESVSNQFFTSSGL